MKNIPKTLFLVGGLLCILLAFIGIFVPVLPTTPFLLLAAFLFTRSSRRALHWLENNRLFGSYIRNYRAGRGMGLREKVVTLLLLWITIGASIVLIVEHWWLQLFLLLVAGGVTTHLVRIKTYPTEPGAEQEAGS